MLVNGSLWTFLADSSKSVFPANERRRNFDSNFLFLSKMPRIAASLRFTSMEEQRSYS